MCKLPFSVICLVYFRSYGRFYVQVSRHQKMKMRIINSCTQNYKSTVVVLRLVHVACLCMVVQNIGLIAFSAISQQCMIPQQFKLQVELCLCSSEKDTVVLYHSYCSITNLSLLLLIGFSYYAVWTLIDIQIILQEPVHLLCMTN